MSNRELLELAAKAGGIEGEYESWCVHGFNEGIRQVIDGSKCHMPWNPLKDDGQALRLAVKLQMGLSISQLFAWAIAENDMPSSGVTVTCENGGDINAATRRAIVRAAAEIGRKK